MKIALDEECPLLVRACAASVRKIVEITRENFSGYLLPRAVLEKDITQSKPEVKSRESSVRPRLFISAVVIVQR